MNIFFNSFFYDILDSFRKKDKKIINFENAYNDIFYKK